MAEGLEMADRLALAGRSVRAMWTTLLAGAVFIALSAMGVLDASALTHTVLLVLLGIAGALPATVIAVRRQEIEDGVESTHVVGRRRLVLVVPLVVLLVGALVSAPTSPGLVLLWVALVAVAALPPVLAALSLLRRA